MAMFTECVALVTTPTVVLMLPVPKLLTPALVTLPIRVPSTPLIGRSGPLEFPRRLVVPRTSPVVGGAPATNANDWLLQMATLMGTIRLCRDLAVVPQVP